MESGKSTVMDVGPCKCWGGLRVRTGRGGNQGSVSHGAWEAEPYLSFPLLTVTKWLAGPSGRPWL